MAYQYLTKTNIFRRYEEAKRYTDKLTTPFPEFARLARNKPAPNIAPYPAVTDGTLSSIIEENSRQVVQQAPTGVVTSDQENDWLPIVADFIYREKILPFANADYDLLEKSQLVVKNAGAFGSCATFDRFAQHDFNFGPDPEIIYWGDLMLQKGKKSGEACSYLFYRVWWQKSDIQSLIDSENQRAAEAKKRGEKYEATWDPQALQAVLDSATEKDQQATTETEEDRGLDANGIELITGFQKGVKANFYTFEPNSKKIVRTKVNNDPRGKMPIQWCYCEIDGTNPLGRGYPEVVGAIQNFMDARMQMAGYASALELNPPTVVYGEFNEAVEYLPNAVFHASTPDAKIIPLDVNTTAQNDYIQSQSYLQSQLYQRVGGQHSNIPSGSGVITDGKTPAAINSQNARLDVDVNTLRKHFEAWWESWSEDAINRYFAERAGKELLQLDEVTADKLRALIDEGHLVLDKNGLALLAKNQMIIDYDSATPALRFKVDPSSSKVQDDASQLKALETLQQFIDSSQTIQQIFTILPEKAISILNSVIGLVGLEDPEKLKITDEEKDKVVERLAQLGQKMPTEAINFKDLPAAGQIQEAAQAGIQLSPQDVGAVQPQQQPQLPPVTQQHIQELRAQGVPDNIIAQAIQQYQNQGTGNV